MDYDHDGARDGDSVCDEDVSSVSLRTSCFHFLCTVRAGHLIPHKWESGQKIQPRSWGFIRNTDLSGYLNITEILRRLVTTVRYNNYYTLHTDVHVYIHIYIL